MSELVSRLRAAGCVFAEEEAALIEAATDHPDDPGERERLTAARVAGAPLEALLGWAQFDGHRVQVDPGVFVPRQRTALLVELAAEAAPEAGLVVDLCCGTGALGAALLHRRPDVTVHAADVDPAAVACARRNLTPSQVHEGDLFAALPARLRSRVDVLLANAPYVPTAAIGSMPPEAREHEHRVALDGGPDGLDVHRRVAAEAAGWLTTGGILLIEVATEQVEGATALLADRGFRVDVVVDDDRGATVVRGVVSARAARPSVARG